MTHRIFMASGLIAAAFGFSGLSAPDAFAEAAWRPLPAPQTDDSAYITGNPMQGFFEWNHSHTAPTSSPATEHYIRVAWADLEPRPGQYDLSPLEKALATLGPDDRIAFAVMPMDSCCSHHNGVDVPVDMAKASSKGFWINADPNGWSNVKKVYVPDWNDPAYLARWRALWTAIGKRFNGDPRVAWVDLRGYGNWGEGHLNGAAAYRGGAIPYTDATVNPQGAQPGTDATRFAIVDAIIDAMPRTQLLAMTDDKAVLLHVLKAQTAIPIGMRRDSWGSHWFDSVLAPDSLSPEDKALITNRWKIAPFVVESFGANRVFEVGFDGIVHQIEAQHVSTIANGNFNVDRWEKLSPDQQDALKRAGNRAGYRYVPSAIAYRMTGDAACPVAVQLTWQNHGVAPAYEAWQVRAQLTSSDQTIDAKAVPLPAILPGEEAATTVCFSPAGKGDYTLSVQVGDANSRRVMQLALSRDMGGKRYALGQMTVDDGEGGQTTNEPKPVKPARKARHHMHG